MKYAVRISLEEHDIAPEHWPTLTAENYIKATSAAKPWIDAGCLVEITPIGEGEPDGD